METSLCGKIESSFFVSGFLNSQCETTVASDHSLHSVAAAVATSWAAEKLALVQMLEGLQRKPCLQLGMTATNKADRDSLKLTEENLGSRPCIGADGGETITNFNLRLASEQSKQAVLEDHCLKTVDSAAQQWLIGLKVDLQALKRTHKMFKAKPHWTTRDSRTKRRNSSRLNMQSMPERRLVWRLNTSWLFRGCRNRFRSRRRQLRTFWTVYGQLSLG